MLDSEKWDPKTPKCISDIVGNTPLWKTLQDQIHTNTCMNIVLVGPPGSGKSLFLRLALAKFLTLYIDCTANFGLRDVRDSIRYFARGGRDGNNLRWIIFEHADALTADTQAYLRRMLETTHNTTRICFECNDAGAITEPILSRCSLKYVYAPDPTEVRYEIQRRTEYSLSDDTIEAIFTQTSGNMRTAILRALAARHVAHYNIQQDTSTLKGLLEKRESMDLLQWALESESTCRNQGIDLRALLIQGWGNNYLVTQTLTNWSRLGGISGRAQFFTCISNLHALDK